MSARPRRPQLAHRADPRFAGLPFGTPDVRRFVVASPTAAAARTAEGYLVGRGWEVHHIGAARAAHGPNGARWVFAWRVADGPMPGWAAGLPELPSLPPEATAHRRPCPTRQDRSQLVGTGRAGWGANPGRPAPRWSPVVPPRVPKIPPSSPRTTDGTRPAIRWVAR